MQSRRIEPALRVAARLGRAAAGWLAIAALLSPSTGRAVPAFARRYQTSCATCHQAWPRLNAVGESFRLAGFRFVDDERYRKVQQVELGDEAYKRLWPEALWPTDVPPGPPLSFITRLMAEGDLNGDRPHRVTFLFPEEIELVWAGNFAEDFSIYGDIIFLQKDFGGGEPQAWATLKAWIQYQGLLGENLMNVRLGTVGTQTMGLFTARDANFYGTHYYLYTSWLMPVVDAKEAGLAEFKGNNFTIGPQAGLELNGFGKRWFYAAGIVSGDLLAPASGPPQGDVQFFGMGTGGASDAYLQLAFKLGGIPFDRARDAAAESLAPAPQFWRDDSVILSAFGYRGEATIRAVGTDGTVRQDDDRFWRAGAGIQAQYGDLSLSGAFVEGRNDRPYGPLSPESVRSRAWHVEAIWFAYPWLLPYGRYEVLQLQVPQGLPGVVPDQDRARLLVGAKAMIRPNVGLVAESAYYFQGAELEAGFDRTLFVLLAVAL